MKIRTLAVLAATLMSMGCGVWINGPANHHHDESGDTQVSHAYIDTYLDIPTDISDLIAPSVDGYFSPALSRYGEYLYPGNAAYDAGDLPCFVKADFNGDGYYDYAFLFSSEEWSDNTWYLTTKLVVVLSTRNGYEIGADEILGTVYADASVPEEEYWSIFNVSAGSHSITSVKNGATDMNTVTLDNDGFYLASLDPQEEALFYADQGSVYEMEVGADLAKKQALSKTAGSEKRSIAFNKNIEGRVKPVK